MDEMGGSTGHRASSGRTTSGLVRLQDRLASVLITSGGMAVLLAMLGICVFLVVSAAPLFAGGKLLGEIARYQIGDASPAWMSVDTSFDRLIALDDDGIFRVHDLHSGELLTQQPALENSEIPASINPEAGEGWLTITTDTGAFELVRPALTWEPVEQADDAQSELTENGSFVQSFEDGSLRRWTLDIERKGPFRLSDTALAVDSKGKTQRERSFAAIDNIGLVTGRLSGRRALGGKVRFRVSIDDFGLDAAALGGIPDWVFATGDGRWVYAVWKSGRITAIDREATDAALRILEASASDGAPSIPITTAVMSLGSQTLLVGDAQGGVAGWAVYGKPERLRQRLHQRIGTSAVTMIRPGDRDRTIVVGFADTSAVMFNQLSRKRIVTVHPDNFAPLASVAGSPGSDAIVLVDTQGTASVFGVEPGHVESSFAALFGKIPYEGYDEPVYVYQSTGSASAEPKYSLVPLIFGTLKATVVAMLFAVPLAVLAAIYSGEFLSNRVRKYVKPTIELMASLPSVVLGFMAAMLVAPFVRDQLPRVLVLAATGPMVVILAAHAWRMIPRNKRARLGPAGQFAMIVLATVAGVLLAIPAGGTVERLFFAPGSGAAPSIRGWLDGDFGGPMPGWTIAAFPITAALLLLIDATLLSPMWRSATRRWRNALGGLGAHAIEFFRLLFNLAAAGVFAYIVASVLSAMGFDPRDSIFGPFSQRNTLVVGLIMGIAVIPIIYTIAEDAIRSVPGSLRSASLGVGATPWQTAVRVVLPVAASGIFSAIMVGLGRAVGETMIVLMATGNTPEMSLNIFSGFRTLAANIAVELPEAPTASTHYRVLFLCGLVLFAMTLVINTSAEFVRQHFRKKNAAL